MIGPLEGIHAGAIGVAYPPSKVDGASRKSCASRGVAPRRRAAPRARRAAPRARRAVLLAVLLAPLLLGWVNQCRAWLQNKSGPGVLRPYLMLRKLMEKDAVVAHGASPLFRTAPYIVFGCMVLAVAIVPTLGTDLPYAPAADAIALVGILALAR